MGLDDAVILMYPACGIQASGDQGQSSTDSALASPQKHQDRGLPEWRPFVPGQETPLTVYMFIPLVSCVVMDV